MTMKSTCLGVAATAVTASASRTAARLMRWSRRLSALAVSEWRRGRARGTARVWRSILNNTIHRAYVATYPIGFYCGKTAQYLINT
jgi:hypothetical protein